jgi:hypothetical protein
MKHVLLRVTEHVRVIRNNRPMKVSAKAVVLEVLSAGESIYQGTLPVSSHVQAATVFDIAENSVRVAIVRLRSEGLLESPGRGEYRLGPSAKAVNEKIHGWRTASQRVGDWDGSWAAAFTADLSRTDRPALRRRLRALRYLGFEELKPGLFVRPNNLTPGIEGIREELVALGLDLDAAHAPSGTSRSCSTPTRSSTGTSGSAWTGWKSCPSKIRYGKRFSSGEKASGRSCWTRSFRNR